MFIYTDDPDRDFAVYDANRQKELDKLPHCCCCEEPIQEAYYFEDEDGIFCEDCWHNVVRDKYMRFQ